MKPEEEKIMDEGKHFPSHFGEVYDAMPEKFEKRKDKVKPMIYWGLTAVCVLLVIFPGWLPFIPSWLVRTAGIIGAIFCVLTALAAGLKIYNRTSGGKVQGPVIFDVGTQETVFTVSQAVQHKLISTEYYSRITLSSGMGRQGT